MRAIEEKMIQAIESRTSWKSGNTEVNVFMDGTGFVALHGNTIAFFGHHSVTLKDGGWQTVTTKSRLNALATHFGVHGVYQKNFEWFFTDDVPFMNDRIQKPTK